MIPAITLTGTIELSQRDIEGLRKGLSGHLVLPGDAQYEITRLIWNRMIDRRPALIVRCATGEDVVHAVRFARERDLLMSIRGGGHNVTGNAVCDGGLMIDLSPMKGTHIDPARRVATAEAGLTWGEFDTATQRFGLATTGGFVSTTGLAGLTLGGGHGWLMRRRGLTCDNLLSATVVTAEGRVVRASAEEHSDLFWGLRGGGGNFGVVTSFEFQLHPLEKVLAGVLLFPMRRAKAVLEHYREFALRAPDELTAHILITTWFDGDPVIAVGLCYSGELAAGERVIQPLRDVATPIADTVRPMTYTELQTQFDSTNLPGNWYYKTGYFDADRLGDAGLIDTLIAHCDFASPSPTSRVVIEHMGGAIARVDPAATAFTHRSAPLDLIIIAGGFAAEESEQNIGWARRTWEAMRPYLSGRFYVNYLGGDVGADGVRGAYGTGYARLARLKATYDPGNVFRLNQNVKPEAGAPATWA